MLKPTRNHLTYANVTATLALVFAMSGGALAAQHYLINSTKQISPKVLKKLKGNTGKTGKTGATGATGGPGATGAQGPAGKEGPQGKEGPEGPEGQSALSPLPSGESESGAYGVFTLSGVGGAFMKDSVTFPIPLAAGIPQSKVVWTFTGSASHCSGPGNASPGYLCLYSAHHIDIEEPEVFNSETSSVKHETGLAGMLLEWEITTSPAYDNGTFTVTAP